MPWPAGVTLRALEAAIPIVVGTAWGTLWAALAAHALPLPASTILRTATAHGLASAATALALITLTSLWRPPTLQALKDR
ncbi:hypothetical protein [Xylanimonas allomyrinae]|uniref:hypothetical protein n=1 Tax=Xylanimonas allomyrinae TaxID=2509459 RepID=UPI0013A63039|nr:hypothetical protein [Xylanimonas allomyrinae]